MNWQPVLTFTESISDWTQVEVDLSAYAGQRVGVAFVLEEVAGEGGGSARLQPSMPVEGAKSAAPIAATALPLAAVALAGVAGAANRGRYRRWKKYVIVGGVVLAVGWVCLFPCGLWRYVPLLRPWTDFAT